MQRKIVSVLFCDLVGSTSLGERTDPELLRELMSRYHREARTILERHGGTVEKFVGDAAMAVFGVPRAHEDDALRATRAAAELRDAVARLGLEARIGVNTGEVVTDPGEALVTGDAVNVAARLEQAASPNEILLGGTTHAVVRGAIRSEPLEPLVLKGKSASVPAWRLLELLPDAPARTSPADSVFVGREGELAALEEALGRAVEMRSPQLVTLVGPPGIGKSRLVRELIQRTDAAVLAGRCLSYGEGITYWPLREMLVESDQRSALEGTADEIASRVRTIFERSSAERALIVLFDDIHWAEPTLLDLIEYVAAFAQDAKLLLLCTARSDLLDSRPSWATPKRNASLLTLDPLTARESAELLSQLGHVSDAVRARIVAAAEGNPFFVEQLVATQAERDDAQLVLPPTIQALLAARIDRLDPPERAVIERAAVEGRTFHRGAVAELVPEEVRADVGAHLLTLMRKELVKPDRAIVPGDDGYRFAHILVRDAAYDSMPKRLRAELHERYAGWVRDRLGDGAPDEILGYHLEQAYRYGVELRSSDEALGTRAAGHLIAAGTRAFERDDSSAAVRLLERALALPAASTSIERVELRYRVVIALTDLGRFREARAAAERAAADARAAGDLASEARIAEIEAYINVWAGPDERLLERIRALLPALETAADDRALRHAWRVVGLAMVERGRHAEASDAFHRALVHARRLNDAGAIRSDLGWIEYVLFQGPVPVDDAVRWTEAHSLPAEQLSPTVRAVRGGLLAAAGRVEEAQRLVAEGVAHESRLGRRTWTSASHEFGWYVETIAGDHAAAEQHARVMFELASGSDAPLTHALSAGMVAQSLCMQGRYEEAAPWVETAEERSRGMSRELTPVVCGPAWQARAKVVAHRGDLAAAEGAAREAVALMEGTDAPRLQADALLDLAEVFDFAGKMGEARDATAHAVALYKAKGLVLLAARAHEQLAARAIPAD